MTSRHERDTTALSTDAAEAMFHPGMSPSSSASEHNSDDESLELGACIEQAAASLLLLASAAARLDVRPGRASARAPHAPVVVRTAPQGGRRSRRRCSGEW